MLSKEKSQRKRMRRFINTKGSGRQINTINSIKIKWSPSVSMRIRKNSLKRCNRERLIWHRTKSDRRMPLWLFISFRKRDSASAGKNSLMTTTVELTTFRTLPVLGSSLTPLYQKCSWIKRESSPSPTSSSSKCGMIDNRLGSKNSSKIWYKMVSLK